MTNLPKSPRNDTVVDISSLAFWNKSFQERDESFARPRAAAPVSWHLPIEVDYPHDEHPAQRDWPLADFDGRIMPAIEEFVRYATPVLAFARTAGEDTELGGAHIAAGDKVVLFYCSGNRDDALVANPAEFDLSRPRSRHVSFGGGGPHYCLGNGVAKTQLRALFKQLLTRIPDIELGKPEPLRRSFINGVERLPVHIG